MEVLNTVYLIVFFSLGNYYPIQAETIRGVDIPRVNVSRMAGEWHVVALYEENPVIECSTGVVVPQSDDTYVLNVLYSFTSEAKKNNPNLPDGTETESFIATMKEDSSVVNLIDGDNYELFEVLFDIDYDSYMAIYWTETLETVTSGKEGNIFIVSRQRTLEDGILEKVKQSVFYEQGVNPNLEFTILDATDCA